MEPIVVVSGLIFLLLGGVVLWVCCYERLKDDPIPCGIGIVLGAFYIYSRANWFIGTIALVSGVIVIGYGIHKWIIDRQK